ncbi:MAG TPA: 3-hydroxyacyl-CoA dehydrogenase NAD-binding domain-containing protein [Baekduia sp.]|uniref:3-hydroxyacyl-CoA dehydrogenase NAD-binding domain-containing protein n=1 Tax=Baekduia sp. TaxID=2600305 RepID=UPI002D79CBA6|nr:3-hydroxyacyl-CoA dehydrogenase NAD-binding domain-containing protein [Baekduia sp.]HET6507282.1 3-hydroxyacyl-CoA dehydrogenase NAD-binding domain-containing protein [Baekduia sp.]
MASESTTIKWDKGEDGIVVLTLDDPNQSANTMNRAYIESMGATVDRLEAEKDSIKGIVLTSAKKTFFAGGDLHDLKAVTREQSAEFAEGIRLVKGQLRRLETLGVPVAAAINGAALGGGLEIALATHYRVIVDSPKAKLGFPEVKLGLLPGGGGVVRTVRMFGIVDALMQLLLQGQEKRPAQALEMGLVNEVVPTVDDLVPAAKKWIDAQGEDFAGQPWDVKGYKIPGGTPSNPKLAMNLPAFPANLRKQLKGANYPAPHHIMAVAVEGAQVDFDTAIEIEGRYFVDLATGQVAKNMIQAFFFDLQQVSGDRGRPDGLERFAPKKVVVLGAGMMGAAIAYVCAKAGIEVVLKDVDQAAADRGKGYSVTLVEKAVGRGRQSQEDGDALLARITPTTDPAAAAGADLVIEAVFEDPGVKKQVMAEIEPHLAPDALLGSNTSTLPITALAENVSRPADFIGLHFFSPVDKMPLLEIIKGEQTSEETLHRALDLARLIKKTPIVVNDSRGFYTSRVIGTFINEGIAMLTEGVPAQSIEQASSQAGYPAPVLQLSDELNLELMAKIRKASKEAVESEGGTWVDHPAFGVIDKMLEEGRAGKLRGAGFYNYEDGKRAGLFAGLKEWFPPVADPSQIALKDLEERMLFAESIETIKCLDEGVLETVADANIGSIFGIGFPGWSGGSLQYVNGYEGGLAGFVARARELAEKYGDRFEPPASLVAKAEAGESYNDAPAPVAA